MSSMCLQRHCQEMLATNTDVHHESQQLPSRVAYTCAAFISRAYKKVAGGTADCTPCHTDSDIAQACDCMCCKDQSKSCYHKPTGSRVRKFRGHLVMLTPV